ncbi:hypothetical protein M409DRAFT_63311 [Zasmidium cellare ATCC 36951]|uniref:Rhodopsin domain-containing protein n=1 Tax=Zasmidium cellare ATCC 36951 TaxID=1080233 RepID=A0A6A6CWW0_ZASCE|nr:uncharacterized protein M409DRAFT_63311 [Zasmidium cellare ATCC 36951]KAF2171697.1 hypothetical protein M409DRAFT_63311 [Zasmidium cellare ATCC 36951]
MAEIDTSNWTPGTRYFTQITDENHSGWLYIITLLSFIYVVIAFVIRFIVKYGMYGYDDWALLVSTVLAVGQYIAVLAGLSKGLGKGSTLLSRGQIEDIQRYAASYSFLYILAHCGSKISTGILTLRLFENGRTRNTYLCWFLVAASAAFGLGSILSLAVGCTNPAFPVIPGQDAACPNRIARWQIILALDVITETLLVVVPVFLLLDILIKRSAKITVTIVFGVRLVDIIFAALNLSRVTSVITDPDPPLTIVPSLIWTQAELLWSILAASLPCLKTFMRPFDKIDEETWRSNNNMYSSGRSGRSWKDTRVRDGAVPLDAVKGHKEGVLLSASGSDSRSLGLRPENIMHSVEISHPSNTDAESEGRKSWGSQERIIKAQTDFEIRREGGRDPYEIP